MVYISQSYIITSYERSNFDGAFESEGCSLGRKDAAPAMNES